MQIREKYGRGINGCVFSVCVRCVWLDCMNCTLSHLSLPFYLPQPLLPHSLALCMSPLSLLLSKVQDNDTVFLGSESELRNGYHSNSSCPVQPAHFCGSLSVLHCASQASKIIGVFVCGGRSRVGRHPCFPSSVSHLISIGAVSGSANAAVITLISCVQLLSMQ